jgi:hypothetical protein
MLSLLLSLLQARVSVSSSTCWSSSRWQTAPVLGQQCWQRQQQRTADSRQRKQAGARQSKQWMCACQAGSTARVPSEQQRGLQAMRGASLDNQQTWGVTKREL